MATVGVELSIGNRCQTIGLMRLILEVRCENELLYD